MKFKEKHYCINCNHIILHHKIDPDRVRHWDRCLPDCDCGHFKSLFEKAIEEFEQKKYTKKLYESKPSASDYLRAFDFMVLKIKLKRISK